MQCEWCGTEITGWHLTYKGKCFCRSKDDACLKNYLFEENDEDIGMDKVIDDYYDMSHVDDDLDFGGK